MTFTYFFFSMIKLHCFKTYFIESSENYVVRKLLSETDGGLSEKI